MDPNEISAERIVMKTVKKEGRVFWYGYCVSGVKWDCVAGMCPGGPVFRTRSRGTIRMIIPYRKLRPWESFTIRWGGPITTSRCFSFTLTSQTAGFKKFNREKISQ
jgi:hypothetical protein